MLGPVVYTELLVKLASKANIRLTAVHPSSCAALEETGVSLVSPREKLSVGNNAVLLFRNILMT